MDERLRLGVGDVGPFAPDALLEPKRDQLARDVGKRDFEEQPGTAPKDRQHGRDRKPDEALGAYP
jgi:hypothetical protein